jgi:NADH-quinone oxidoreductase subunit J
MKASDFLFLFFGALAVIPALLCVTATRNIVRAAFLLMLSFWGVAGLYALLGADFLMAVQLIVYVGGILVLILFGVMLSRRMSVAELPVGVGAQVLGLAGSAALGWFLFAAIRWTPWNATELPRDTETIRPIGELFLDKFLLPFELVSVVLLAALIGAVVIARKEFDDPGPAAGQGGRS